MQTTTHLEQFNLIFDFMQMLNKCVYVCVCENRFSKIQQILLDF